MNSSSTAVTAELGFRLVLPQRKFVPLMASLYYTASDPYAIRIAFHVGLSEPVEWTFARELLAKGAEEATGLADVKIWPSAESNSGLTGTVLNMELSSPHGEARFEIPIREITGFLSRTYDLVPEGQESGRLSLDEALDDLLRGAQ